MKTSEWREFIQDGTRYRIRAIYGFQIIGNQEPYVSVTSETEVKKKNGRWYEDSCGCQHAQVMKLFPELAPLVKWHLSFKDSGPMHYVANALYWFQKAAGRSPFKSESYDPDPIAAFKSTVVFGAVENDELPPLTASDDEVRAWLNARFPTLMAAQKQALSVFFSEEGK